MANQRKVSGVARVDDPQPRLRIELSGIAFFDAEDVAALNDLMALPPPKPPLFSQAEQNRITAEYQRKVDAARDAKAAALKAEEARVREQFPELANKILGPEEKRPEERTYVIGGVPVSM